MEEEEPKMGRPIYAKFKVDRIIKYVDNTCRVTCCNPMMSLQFSIEDENGIPEVGEEFAIVFQWKE